MRFSATQIITASSVVDAMNAGSRFSMSCTVRMASTPSPPPPPPPPASSSPTAPLHDDSTGAPPRAASSRPPPFRNPRRDQCGGSSRLSGFIEVLLLRQVAWRTEGPFALEHGLVAVVRGHPRTYVE